MADKPEVTKTETQELRRALKKHLAVSRLTLGEVFVATGVKPSQTSPLLKHGIPIGRAKAEKLWAFLMGEKSENAKTPSLQNTV